MKKLVLLVLFVVFLFSAKAQFTGGGQETQAPAKSPAASANMGLFIRFGTSAPGSDLKSTYNFKSGYVAEAGFMPDFDSKKRKVSGGMIISDDFAWYKHETQPSGSETFSAMGIKVGPAIHIKPVSKLVISAYYAIHGIWAFGKFNGVEQTDMKLSFMSSLGFNVKFTPFILGMEFDAGKMNIQGLPASINFPSTRLTIGFSM